MTSFNSLKKAPLALEVEAQIKDSIISGRFNPGDKLPSERELVEQFQVSRTTVREALRSIQHLGLIYIKRGIQAGTYVADPNSGPITRSFQNLIAMGKVTSANLIDARLMIEPEVARIAAIQHTDEDIQKLTELLDRAERQARFSCKEARLINVHFHNEVAKIIQNPIILFISESITQIFSAVLIEITQTEIDEAKVLELISHHRKILSAIADREDENAWRLTREHLLKTREMYASILLSSDKNTKQRATTGVPIGK
jgi:GntR family transcriptional regulator, transcriptional repressor for pyruvate dehydrogenase complex